MQSYLSQFKVNLLNTMACRINCSLSISNIYFYKKNVMVYYGYLQLSPPQPNGLKSLNSDLSLISQYVTGNRFSLNICINESSHKSVDFTRNIIQLQTEILVQVSLTHNYVCHKKYQGKGQQHIVWKNKWAHRWVSANFFITRKIKQDKWKLKAYCWMIWGTKLFLTSHRCNFS